MKKIFLAIGLAAVLVMAGCINGVEKLPPENVSAQIQGRNVFLSWSASQGASSYNIFRTTKPGEAYEQIGQGIDFTDYLDESLAGGTYYYAVQAVYGDGTTSELSNEVNATIAEESSIIVEHPEYAGLCEDKESELQKDLCILDYAKQKNDYIACKLLTELKPDSCYKEVASKTQNSAICLEIADQGIADECYNSVALALNDAKICNNILDTDKKSTCINSLSLGEIQQCYSISDQKDKDTCILNIAVKNLDYLSCKKITYSIDKDSYRDRCLDQIYEKVKEKELCPIYIDQNKEDSCYKEVALNLSDKTLCSNIVDANTRNLCTFEINKKEQSIEACSELADSDLKQSCYKEIADTNSNLTVCTLLSSYLSKDQCYYGIAVTNTDSAQCQNIFSIDTKNYCYKGIAVDTNNHFLCTELSTKNIEDRFNCISEIALNSLDTGKCEDISSLNFYIECFSDIAVFLKEQSLCESIKERAGLQYNIQDYCYYNYAEETKDSTACMQIRNSTFQNDCDVNALS